MKAIIKSKLLKDLSVFSKANLFDLDRKSFKSGYSNGFVQGFYFAKKWLLITLAIVLVICGATFYLKGLGLTLIGYFALSFISFVFGASRERILSIDVPDFKNKAIKALEEQIVEDAKTNADDSHRHAYEESIRIIKEI